MRLRKLLPGMSVLVLALALLPKTSAARSVMPTLEELTKSAKLVVVARVEEIAIVPIGDGSNSTGVRAPYGEKRVATARVLEVWKGTASGETVQFRASKSWTCDVSTAMMGETVLLFLTDDSKDSTAMAIAFNGIGRLPVESNSILLYSSLLTTEIKALLALPEKTFKHPVEIQMLKRQVQKLMDESADKTKPRASSDGVASRKR